jgi:uncharacterized membrane protein
MPSDGAPPPQLKQEQSPPRPADGLTALPAPAQQGTTIALALLVVALVAGMGVYVLVRAPQNQASERSREATAEQLAAPQLAAQQKKLDEDRKAFEVQQAGQTERERTSAQVAAQQKKLDNDRRALEATQAESQQAAAAAEQQQVAAAAAVPWPERARAIAISKYRQDGADIAKKALHIIHPTGTGAQLTNYTAAVRGNELVSSFAITWDGEFVRNYVTTVEWRCAEGGDQGTSIVADSAAIHVDPSNAAQLSRWFREEMYPWLAGSVN